MSSLSDQSTVAMVCESVELLREGDVVLGDGDLDYAAADFLEALIDLDGTKQAPVLDLERMPSLLAFVVRLLYGRDERDE